MNRFQVLLALLLPLLLIVPIASAAAATPEQRIDLRVLLVVKSPQDGPDTGTLIGAANAWADAMTAAGVPFEVVDAQAASLVATAVEPRGPTDHPLAEGSGHARYQGVVTTAEAAAVLTAEEEAALEWLQDSFGVRRTTPYVWPQATYGLSAEGVIGGAGLPEAELAPAGRSAFGELAGPVPFDEHAWGYQGASVLPGADFTTLVAWSNGSPAVGVHRGPNGREQLVALVDTNPWMVHARLLVPGMLRWLTRGVHLGHERRYLSLHIDDVLLGDDRWDVQGNQTPEGGPNPIRMTAADVDRAAAWSARTGQRLDMVYNGAGLEEHAGPDGRDPLFDRLLANRDAFGWINHTYTHLNLDHGEQGAGHVVDAATIADEVNRNIEFAATHGLPIDERELVTGQHSGLGNPNMPAALAQTPVTWIAEDNSRKPVQYRLGPAVTVPRHPANIYYNVATMEEQLDEYNFIYFDGCTDSEVTTCLERPATWNEYVDAEARIMLSHVLGNDPRPHYVHQSNLAEDGVLYPIVDEVLRRHDALYSTPIEQPTQVQAGTLLQRQAGWSAATAAGSARGYLQGGAVHLESDRPTAIPVTGTVEGEPYGGVRSAWLLVDGVRTVPLDGPTAPPTDPTDPPVPPAGPTDPTTPPTPPPSGPSTPPTPPIDPPPAQPELGTSVRLGGADRIDTAVQVSKRSYEALAAGGAVIARADLFADALAGSPLAAAEGGPVLLTSSASLHPQVAAELQRIVPTGSTVFLLGGTSALSDDVAAAVEGLGYQARRLGGADRYATALRIATDGLGDPATLLLATGGKFPDALAAGAAAVGVQGAVLLTGEGTLPVAVEAYLAGRPEARTYAIGGPAVAAAPGAQGISGADRYETARLVAEAFFPEATSAGLASGQDFPDALAGGAHIGSLGGPLLLSWPDELHPASQAFLAQRRSGLRTVFLYGGERALTPDVEAGALGAIR